MTVGSEGHLGSCHLCAWVKPSCPPCLTRALRAPGIRGPPQLALVRALSRQWAAWVCVGLPQTSSRSVSRLSAALSKPLSHDLRVPSPCLALPLAPCPPTRLALCLSRDPTWTLLLPEAVGAWGLPHRVELLWGDPGAPTRHAQTSGAGAHLAFLDSGWVRAGEGVAICWGLGSSLALMMRLSSALAVTFRPDGAELAVATLNSQITFWDPENAVQTGSIEGRHDLKTGRKELDKVTAKHSAKGK